MINAIKLKNQVSVKVLLEKLTMKIEQIVATKESY